MSNPEEEWITCEDLFLAKALDMNCQHYLSLFEKSENYLKENNASYPRNIRINAETGMPEGIDDQELFKMWMGLNSYSYTIYILAINLSEAIFNSFLVSSIGNGFTKEEVKSHIRAHKLADKLISVPKLINEDYELTEDSEIYKILSKGNAIRNSIIHTKYDFEDSPYKTPYEHITEAETDFDYFIFKVMRLPFLIEKHLYNFFPGFLRSEMIHHFDTVTNLQNQGVLKFQ